MASRKSKSSSDALVMVPLGGVGEIGMNVYLYGAGPEAERQWIMVDLGITFPGEAEPGVDVVLPDLAFIEAERHRLLGIVLTHAHEDHFGAVIELWPRLRVPIYATPFTAALLRAKLRDERSVLELPIREVRLGGRVKTGPFEIEYVTVAHSIPESNALAIRTPLGMVFHTADWKLDPAPVIGMPSDEKRIRELGEEGVGALICDSTNALRDGISPSEEEVGHTLARLIRSAKRRVAVTTFASNVARIRSVANAARAAGRELVVVGRAMHRIIEVAQETGCLDPSLRYHDQSAFANMKREHVVALCTGSQGEPRAALSRIAVGEHPDVTLDEGDLVIFSSRPIPGNEKAISRVMDGLADLGVEIVTDSDALVHVTGHPRRGELEQMYAWTKPACLVPMHGEIRHLEEQARFARAKGVPHVVHARNGTMVRLLPGPAAVVDEVPVGRIYRDGRLLVPAEAGIVRDRRKLSFVGVVVVALVIEKGELAADPAVVIEGIPREDEEGSAMESLVLDAVEGAVGSIPKARRKDIELVRDAAARAARAAINEAWGKKPVCKVLVTVL